jgi:hypothetical protein
MAHGKKTKTGVERNRFSALDEPLTPSAIIHLLDLRRDWPTLASSRREDAAATRPTEQPLGATWGMRPEVATRAANCLHEVMIYFNHIGIRSPVHIEAKFDEFDLNFDIDYAGPPIRFPDQPPRLEAIASEAEAMLLLCAYAIRGYADGVTTSSHEQKSHIHLHFDH